MFSETLSTFEATCQKRGWRPEELLAGLLGGEPTDVEAQAAFWGSVQLNLESRRLPLLFVAYKIPLSLRRVVEFLNTSMERIEVLAVEVKQYSGGALKTLVPRVLGQSTTSKAITPKMKRQWDEPTFFAELAKRGEPNEERIARALLRWAESRSVHTWWG